MKYCTTKKIDTNIMNGIFRDELFYPSRFVFLSSFGRRFTVVIAVDGARRNSMKSVSTVSLFGFNVVGCIITSVTSV